MKRSKSFEPRADQTVIASGIIIKGDLEAESDIWFDGNINGNISSDGNITIAQNGVVIGNLSAESVMVSGKVKGHINGGQKVLLLGECHVEGDIKTSSLGVAEGAALNGNINTRAEAPEQ